MIKTLTTEINEETAKSPYRWARENLSAARAKAFEKACEKIDREPGNPEVHIAWNKLEEIRKDFNINNWDRIQKIRDEKTQAINEIDEQIRALQKQRDAINNEKNEQENKILGEVYSLPEYKEQNQKVQALWAERTATRLPKIMALMAQYLERQAAADDQN